MKFLRLSLICFFAAVFHLPSIGQQKQRKFTAKPFENKVFIAEQGQFTQRGGDRQMSFQEPILYAVENPEFFAYFGKTGITFQLPEFEPLEEKKNKDTGKAEEEGFEMTWKPVTLKFLNANPLAEPLAEEKVVEYYNYACFKDSAQYNFVPAYKKVKYKNLYPGVDAEFELPAEGGLKYKFYVQPGVSIPVIAFELSGFDELSLDVAGNLVIKNEAGTLTDHAPDAFTALSNEAVPVKYRIEGSTVFFEFQSGNISSPEGIVIDPWITATTFPAANRAFDVQEDAAGNVFVHGSTTNYQVQKYNSSGILQWTYVTTSTFLGDIAVDNPGNVYIIGGYPAGKRQKLDPAGVQLWSFAGLVEEWRMAFDYSKTVLTVGGYFLDPGDNNLGRLDINTGIISDEIIYNAETRGIATDCNGDMYSLHVTFGTGTANAATNMLRKTNANFTPSTAVQSGFLLSEAEPAAGYAPNPTYGPTIFHGINGLAVSGPSLYIFDGASIRRFGKTTLNFIGTVAVPNGSRIMCSGIAADLCGNIYVGSLNGIVRFDSLLNYQMTLPAPGVIYDVLLGANGELLASGEGFVASININCTVPAALTATTNSACDGTGTITITPGGGIGPYTYLWQPGGETTASLSNLPAGTYTYTVSDAFCRTYTGSATVSSNPVVAFSGSSSAGANSVCQDDVIQFTDNSVAASGAIAGWDWDFGDGSPAENTQNPTHSYASDGLFNVRLIVVTDEGCTDTVTVPVTVHPLPVADFTVQPVCFGIPSVFTDASAISSGSIASWDWDFGDTNTSSAQSPSNTYNSDGPFTVVLNVTSGQGCANSSSFTATATVYPLPVADFSTSSFCPGMQENLTDQSAVASGTISNWTWDFADGSPLSNTQNPSHTFITANTYTVNLLVNSNNGCQHDTTKAVLVNPEPLAEFAGTDVCVTAANVFTDLSSVSPPAVITNWAWDIGNSGSTDFTTQHGSHVFPADGTYDVMLTVTSTGGCTDDTMITVTVFPGVVAAFISTAVCLNEPTVFTDQSVVSSGTISSWDWDFGDAGSDVIQNPSHTYGADGSPTVTLLVTSDNGCSSTFSAPANVYPLPLADFSSSSVCEGLTTVFTDNSSVSSGSIATWNWNFGDAIIGAGQNPSHTYLTAGTYTTWLNISSNNGCLDSISKVVTVYPLPVVNFEAVPGDGCTPLNVAFNDLSTISSGNNVGWNWEVENEFTSTLQNGNYVFTQPGLYDVTLKITSDNGCSATATRTDLITIHPKPIAEFSAVPELTEILYPEIEFIDQSGGGPVAWNWQFGTGDVSDIQNPLYSFPDTGVFTVELEVLNQFGCSDTITHTVTILPSFTIYVPEAFTPDGNGVNDIFMPKGIGWRDYELRIFSRWGPQVFESFDPATGWDGKIRDSEEPAPPDVYVWRIYVRDNHKRKQDFIGRVTLVR